MFVPVLGMWIEWIKVVSYDNSASKPILSKYAGGMCIRQDIMACRAFLDPGGWLALYAELLA